MRSRSSTLAAAVLALAAAACAPDQENDPTGTISVDLTNTPPSAKCAIITSTTTGGTVTTKTMSIIVGQTAAFVLTGLPTGNQSIVENVYTSPCTPTPTSATWTSDAVSINLRGGVPQDITFNLRVSTTNTAVTVHTNFPDPPNAITQFAFWDPAGTVKRVAVGPDGNLWVTVMGSFYDIARFNLATQSFDTAYSLPVSNSGALSITAGADGGLWFTEIVGNRIGRITTGGIISEFAVPTANSGPSGIALGADGNIWFTESSVAKIGRITPAGVITEFAIQAPAENIAAGPDSALWYAMDARDRLGRIGISGFVSEFPIPTVGGGAIGVVGGPDGNIWWVSRRSNKAGRMSTSGTGAVEFTFPTAGANPQSITTGPDGNLWATEVDGNKIARITPSGTFSEFAVTGNDPEPLGIVTGPDGNLWFAETEFPVLGRIRAQ